MNKYYLGGKEISAAEKNHILHGEKKERIRGSSIPLIETTDYFGIKNGGIDESDPLLKECLEVTNLLIEKTLIVQSFSEGMVDPLLQARKGAVYACW